MIIKYDFHNMTYDIAYYEAKKIFQKYLKNNFYEIQIICGKGKGIVRKAVIDSLNQGYRKYYKWETPIYGLNINAGVIIIKKRP